MEYLYSEKEVILLDQKVKVSGNLKNDEIILLDTLRSL